MSKRLPCIVSGLLAACSLAAAPGDQTLRQAAGNRFLVGCALSPNDLTDPKHAALIGKQFSVLTAGNDFKPENLQPSLGRFTFDAADQFVAFAQANDMKVVGHTLLWHSQAPKFLFQDESGQPLPREQALANMKEHITKVVTHFKGRVIGWDGVNEGVDDAGPYLRQTPALKAIGEDYIQKAFEYAHAADPSVELYYNDYNIEKPYKFPKALRLLTALKDANVPIHGVGIQGHYLVSDTKAIDELDKAIGAFAELGLKVMVTELDVDVLPRKASGADVTLREQGADLYKDGLPADVAQKQGQYYADIFKVLLKHPGVVTRVTFWGTHDGTSWLNNWPVRGRTNHGLLWQRDLTPKPAFNAIIDVLNAK